MKIYILSGDPSGDLQSSKLMRELNALNPSVQWRGIGGDKMIAEGLSPLYHMKDMAFFGFIEVIKHAPEILKRIRNTKEDILRFNPDLVLFIDYPGFNLKIAKFAKNQGFKTMYYITPQLWAWHKSRVKLMKVYIDEIINIFPFEVDFYDSYGIKSHYYGHPLTEGIDLDQHQSESSGLSNDVEQIGILPGSRLSEVTSLLETMLNSVAEYQSKKKTIIAIGAVDHISKDVYDEIIQKSNINNSDVQLRINDAYAIMKNSQFLIMSSGTATLEAACFHTPMIVCYKLSFITALIVNYVVKIENICLVNIIAGERIVPELVQSQFTSKNILKHIDQVNENRDDIQKKLTKVHQKLAFENVSKNVALHIQRFLTNSSTS